jgi:hypothetical protein
MRNAMKMYVQKYTSNAHCHPATCRAASRARARES